MSAFEPVNTVAVGARFRGVAAAACITWASAGYGATPPLSASVPHDAMAAYFAERESAADDSQSPWSALKTLTFLADRANQAGLLSRLDEATRRWVDVAAAWSMLNDYAHTVVLLDVRARARDDGGHELASLTAGVVVRTHGENQVLTDRIQHLLSLYTNTELGSLSEHSSGDVRWFTLQDTRLPEWARISWGAVGEDYVVTIGNGAFERILKARRDPDLSLAQDAWFARAVGQRTRSWQKGHADAPEPPFIALVRFDRLRRCCDPVFDAKVQWVQYSLGLAGVERGLWLAGWNRTGRSVALVGVYRLRERDEVRELAGDAAASELPGNAIPDGATGYAVIDGSPLSVWRGATNAYFGARASGRAEGAGGQWDWLETMTGVSLERDLLAELDGPIVVHNFPAHALRLPLAWTVQAPIRGDPAALRERMDRVFSAARDERAGRNGVQFERTPDGIWHLRYGLAGPAFAVTDAWLVVSFSPHAVRQNLARLDGERCKR